MTLDPSPCLSPSASVPGREARTSSLQRKRRFRGATWRVLCSPPCRRQQPRLYVHVACPHGPNPFADGPSSASRKPRTPAPPVPLSSSSAGARFFPLSGHEGPAPSVRTAGHSRRLVGTRQTSRPHPEPLLSSLALSLGRACPFTGFRACPFTGFSACRRGKL